MNTTTQDPYVDDPQSEQRRPWITLLPTNPQNIPLLVSLCNDAEKVIEQSPFQVWASIHDNPHIGTLFVCHSRLLVDEAIGHSAHRPIIVWAWLLDEEHVAYAAEHVPVVFGKITYPDVARYAPSTPQPDIAKQAKLCASIERHYGLPTTESLIKPV